MTIRHLNILSNGINLHVAEAGEKNAPLVILLHGFPEAWFAWKKQITAIAEAGFLVWAPDQRGYNLSDKPARVKDYALDLLAQDIVGLIQAAGASKAYIIGHDWGALVAWHLASQHPNVVKKMVILNMPHIQVLRHHMRHSLGQLMKSGYIFMFQIPWLPEACIRLFNYRPLSRALTHNSQHNTFDKQMLDGYYTAWSQTRALTGGINWYRAAFRHPPKTTQQQVTAATLILWGKRDQFINTATAEPSLAYCLDGKIKFYPDNSHWLHHENPPAVNQDIIDFLRQPQTNITPASPAARPSP